MKKFALIFTVILVAFLAWVLYLNSRISSRVQTGWFLPPIEFLGAPESFRVGQTLTNEQWVKILTSYQLRERAPDQKVRDGDFSFWSLELCQSHLSEALPSEATGCVVFWSDQPYLLAQDSESKTLIIYAGEPFALIHEASLKPQIFAQYYGEQPILRQVKTLGQFPLACLQAVTAIEDKDFLEHPGVSVTGTIRALMRNLTKGRFAEGGSTLTQQLVKNYFLTAEKHLSRKITEQIMSVLLEARFSKDQILETYLNEIYMGQSGPFQIRGFASASQFYFQKPVEDLGLSECALLAALINSPGRYSPFNKTEMAHQRRTLVLDKMREQKMLSDEEYKTANTFPLPKRTGTEKLEPAPYFVQAALKELQQRGLDLASGLRIYTTLDLTDQDVAQKSIARGIDNLEKNWPKLKKAMAKGLKLQGALLAVEIETGRVISLVGGREYKMTQYNRAVDSMRQVGSIMKPFVYLTALMEGRKPTDIIADESFKHKFDGKTWSPRNYDGKFNGDVPMYFALMNSLNAATARLALDVGLENVIDTARMAGVESKLEPYPSLSLGAFELRIWEVARAYLTLARMGQKTEPFLIEKVENLQGDVVYKHEQDSVDSGLPPEKVAELIGMMRNTLNLGTAQVARKLNFTLDAAGKTGTTSDFKDTWFAGFTPQILTIVWVGFDNNEPTGLTGASGSVPIWTEFMKAAHSGMSDLKFKWPDDMEEKQDGEALLILPKVNP